MDSSTTNQEYFKQEASMWSSSPSTPTSPNQEYASANSDTDQEYNVYHVPRGYDVVLVPLKVEEQTYSDNACSDTSSVESPIMDSASNSPTKPVDIPKSKTPSSTDEDLHT